MLASSVGYKVYKVVSATKGMSGANQVLSKVEPCKNRKQNYKVDAQSPKYHTRKVLYHVECSRVRATTLVVLWRR